MEQVNNPPLNLRGTFEADDAALQRLPGGNAASLVQVESFIGRPVDLSMEMVRSMVAIYMCEALFPLWAA